jgi:nicotinate-nucleotide adenylyltransferase
MHTSGHYLLLSPVTKLDISASAIRRRLRQGRSVRYLVPPEVEDYIKANALYRDRRQGSVLAKEEDAGGR